jgi:hypothetical protein
VSKGQKAVLEGSKARWVFVHGLVVIKHQMSRRRPRGHLLLQYFASAPVHIPHLTFEVAVAVILVFVVVIVF